jgi:hypothetical protein
MDNPTKEVIKMYEKRDLDLVKCYLLKNPESEGGFKYSIVDLVSKFRISSVRIYQILKKHNIENRE